jgi:hypothetical protein
VSLGARLLLVIVVHFRQVALAESGTEAAESAEVEQLLRQGVALRTQGQDAEARDVFERA